MKLELVSEDYQHALVHLDAYIYVLRKDLELLEGEVTTLREQITRGAVVVAGGNRQAVLVDDLYAWLNGSGEERQVTNREGLEYQAQCRQVNEDIRLAAQRAIARAGDMLATCHLLNIHLRRPK